MGDKNRHPAATEAFQRVSAAWAVLGTPASRERYDLLLRESCREPTVMFSNAAGVHEMSPDDAFRAFAFATTACAAGGAGGDFAETLFWAQQLSQMRQAGEVEQS